MLRFNDLKQLIPWPLLLVTACSFMPEQANYTAKVENDRQGVTVWSQLESAKDTTYLNQLIDSEELNALLTEAMEANPSLQQTLLTLQVRRAQLRQTQADQLPTVEAAYVAENEEGYNNSYTGSLAISWEVDLWQKLNDSSRAAAKDIGEQAALLQAARDSLGADLMKSWLGLIAQRNAIGIEQRRLKTLQQNERFILQRYRSGLGTLEDLDSARSSVASSKATIEAYRETLAQQRRALNTLLGRTQQASFDIASTYPEVIAPLADLPVQTLQRRPDLKAAYLAIQAEELRTLVAYKDMLPSISLGAALTDTAASPISALLSGPIWSLLAQLSAPLYRGGELKAAAEISALDTAYQYQAYRETLLTAVKEVEDALGQERSLARQQTYIESALASARNTLTQYQRGYRTGLVDILELLIVQQQTYDLEAQLDNIVFTRLSNRVDLGLALGLPINTESKG